MKYIYLVNEDYPFTRGQWPGKPKRLSFEKKKEKKKDTYRAEAFRQFGGLRLLDFEIVLQLLLGPTHGTHTHRQR